MVTSAYIDVFADPLLFEKHNVPRNRRSMFVVSLFVGSLIGGYTYKIQAGVPLLISGIIKFIVAFSFILNPSEHPKQPKLQTNSEEDTANLPQGITVGV